MDDLISRKALIDEVSARRDSAKDWYDEASANGDEITIARAENAVMSFIECLLTIQKLPSVQPEEVIPHRNYQYLSDYWCECGWHLGKKESVKYCAECGKKVKWNG